jgi:hypothetical protein
MAHDWTPSSIAGRPRAAGGSTADVPCLVADMDFRRRSQWCARSERAEHPFYGYGSEPEFFEVIVDRLQKRFGWRVGRGHPAPARGHPGFNLALLACAAPRGALSRRRCIRPSCARR